MSKQTFIVGVDTDKKSFEEWIAEHDARVRAEMQDWVEKRCKELGIDYIAIFTCNSAD